MYIILYLLFIVHITGVPCAVQAQEVQTNAATSTAPVQSPQVLPPEIPPTPRSKLEIIQYILLPFAIGASIWLILRLEKMEREETGGSKEE